MDKLGNIKLVDLDLDKVEKVSLPKRLSKTFKWQPLTTKEKQYAKHYFWLYRARGDVLRKAKDKK